jgi:hypothetical protein
MDDLKQLIESVKLPIALPDEAFLIMGAKRIPDLGYIMQNFLAPLLDHFDPNVTAPGAGAGSYYMPLTNGRFLKITLSENQVVGLDLAG